MNGENNESGSEAASLTAGEPDSHIVYIALGTNMGDRDANLRAAIDALAPHVRPLAMSPVYETPPWGYTDQPAFLNQVITAETWLPAQELLAFLKSLEVKLGRTPNFRYGPRQIDLDILFYDDLVLNNPDLTIPHARLAERAFVLVPLADLAPDRQHPVLNKTVAELLKEVDASQVKRYVKAYIG